jgi:hypothetical protein
MHDDRSAQTASQRNVLALDEQPIAEPLSSTSSVRGPGIRARTPWWLFLARRLRSLLNGNDIWRDENRTDPGKRRCAGGTVVTFNAHATAPYVKNVDRLAIEQRECPWNRGWKSWENSWEFLVFSNGIVGASRDDQGSFGIEVPCQLTNCQPPFVVATPACA